MDGERKWRAKSTLWNASLKCLCLVQHTKKSIDSSHGWVLFISTALPSILWIQQEMASDPRIILWIQ